MTTTKTCGTCTFFVYKSHKSVGEGGNGSCKRNKEMFVLGAALACAFYSKKENKVVPKKKEKLPTVRCPHCNAVLAKAGGTWCAKTEWVNIKCPKCNQPVLLSATTAEKREATHLLCTKCFRVLGRIQCKIKGRKGLVCAECYSDITGKIAPKVIEGSGSLETVIAHHMAQVKKCVDCEQYVRSPDKKEGVCVRDNALFVNNPTHACSFYKEKKMPTPKRNKDTALCARDCRFWKEDDKVCQFGNRKRPKDCGAFGWVKDPAEVPKRVICVNCGRKFKTTLAVKGGAEPVCFSCRKKEEKPVVKCEECESELKGKFYYRHGSSTVICSVCWNRLLEKHDIPVNSVQFECGGCGERCFEPSHRVPGIEGYTCAECIERLKKDRPIIKDVNWLNKAVKEISIHERFLIVEGRGAWPYTNVYTHDFYDREKALAFVSRFRPETCKLFRVSSPAPITLEELSLGYDVKVTSTHAVSETK